LEQHLRNHRKTEGKLGGYRGGGKKGGGRTNTKPVGGSYCQKKRGLTRLPQGGPGREVTTQESNIWVSESARKEGKRGDWVSESMEKQKRERVHGVKTLVITAVGGRARWGWGKGLKRKDQRRVDPPARVRKGGGEGSTAGKNG